MDAESGDLQSFQKKKWYQRTWIEFILLFTTLLFLGLWLSELLKDDDSDCGVSSNSASDVSETSGKEENSIEVDTSIYIEFKRLYSEVMGEMVNITIIAPKDWDKTKESLPVMYELPAGLGLCNQWSEQFLTDKTYDWVDDRSDRFESGMDWMFKKARYVIACTTVPPSSWFMSPWDEYWLEEFPVLLNKHWNTKIEGAVLHGTCMGGYGALHLGFREPEKYLAIAATQPGLFPGVESPGPGKRAHYVTANMEMHPQVNRNVTELFELNPANILIRNQDRIKKSGVEIYMDVGDEDEFLYQDGAEYMHRLLFDMDIRHEYRVIRGEGHFNFLPRFTDSWEFAIDVLAGSINKRHHELRGLHNMLAGLIGAFEKSDPEGMARNYGVIPPTNV